MTIYIYIFKHVMHFQFVNLWITKLHQSQLWKNNVKNQFDSSRSVCDKIVRIIRWEVRKSTLIRIIILNIMDNNVCKKLNWYNRLISHLYDSLSCTTVFFDLIKVVWMRDHCIWKRPKIKKLIKMVTYLKLASRCNKKNIKNARRLNFLLLNIV